MRVLFMGSDPVALPLLEILKQKSEVLAVVSGVDKPSGRGQQTHPNEISAWALANKIELYRPAKLDAEFHAEMKKFRPSIIFVMAYGKILKQELIDMAPCGMWNLHASILPKLRGASPIETAIAMGDKETAVALMKVVPALDAGPVGPMIKLEIGEKTSQTLREEVAKTSAELVTKHWDELEKGNLQTIPQNDSEATYCRILRKDDGWLDHNAEAQVLVNRVRAFSEWPGAAFAYAGERLKIYGARVVDPLANTTNSPIKVPPGTVLESGERLVIATAKGSLEILCLQRPGGKRLNAKEFLRGYPIKVGERFFGRPLRSLVDKKPFPRGF